MGARLAHGIEKAKKDPGGIDCDHQPGPSWGRLIVSWVLTVGPPLGRTDGKATHHDYTSMDRLRLRKSSGSPRITSRTVHSRALPGVGPVATNIQPERPDTARDRF